MAERIDRRQNDTVRNAIHSDIAVMKAAVLRMDKVLTGNSRAGIVEIVRRHAVYWKIAIGLLTTIVGSGGLIAAIVRFTK